MDKIKEFCNAILDISFMGLDLNGCDIQELAVKHGVLLEKKVTGNCEEYCACAEVDDFPAVCYRKIRELN